MLLKALSMNWSKRDRVYRSDLSVCRKKIHKIVKKYHDEGYQIIIVGDKNHPEVKGINGWCDNSALIIYEQDMKSIEKIDKKPVCIVAQTTINRKIFGQIVQNIKNTCQTPIVLIQYVVQRVKRQREGR